MAGRNDSGLNTYFMLTNIAFFGTNVQMEISIRLYVHRFSIRRNIFQRQGWVRGAFEQPFAQGRFSTSSTGLSACSGNLLIFLSGCAAYGLLFKQTRALRSNSVFKAIALLARLVQRKSAKGLPEQADKPAL